MDCAIKSTTTICFKMWLEFYLYSSKERITWNTPSIFRILRYWIINLENNQKREFLKFLRISEIDENLRSKHISPIHELETKIGFYAGKYNDSENIEECCYPGEKPDFILLGTFKNFNGKKDFVGRVITNWCDDLPTDSLIYEGKSVFDQGGIAEDKEGNDLWLIASKDFPNLLTEIESLYDYLEIDSDEEHYNLSKEIPDELRLYNLFEGQIVNLNEVKKSNGLNLGIELYL